MPTENRLLNEIKKIVHENRANGNHDAELSDALYDLFSETSIDFYNTMKVNKEEFGTPARFNHWAKIHFKK